nr:glycoside hydrolase family 15 protein [Actinoplanes subtropicus]
MWETRGGRQDFTYGRLMSWVALDRGIRLATESGQPAPLARWIRERDAIYDQIMQLGWSPARQAFRQYVEALARSGRVDQARMTFAKMLTYANHLGLYSEEIALTGEQIGNFPQTFTHLALINAALALDDRLRRPGYIGAAAGSAMQAVPMRRNPTRV